MDIRLKKFLSKKNFDRKKFDQKNLFYILAKKGKMSWVKKIYKSEEDVKVKYSKKESESEKEKRKLKQK